MKKKIIFTAMVLMIIFLLSGCADVQHVQRCVEGHIYGFWGGLWYGMIAPFAFVGSWFSDDIAVWAINNNGGWYTFGFLIGISGTAGGGSASASRRRR